jgi:hypothetical protein
LPDQPKAARAWAALMMVTSAESFILSSVQHFFSGVNGARDAVLKLEKRGGWVHADYQGGGDVLRCGS